MATVTFYGATEGVTGSLYLLQTDRSRVLFECGIFQGPRSVEAANKRPLPFSLDDLDAVVLSHAHLDHSGRLPKLFKDGYTGTAYMTHPTRELLEVMLHDAAYLEWKDAERENRRRLRAGKTPVEPLYTRDDVEVALAACESVAYHSLTEIADGVAIRFADAGHILGSAIVEIFISERGGKTKVVFSGDLGNRDAALLRDPEQVKEADVLLLESTYGDRNHRSMADTLQELEEILDAAAASGGNVLIPAFAVGRTQEIIFRLGELYQAGKLHQRAVYLDSPMAIAATEIYHRYQDVFSREDRAALRRAESGSLHTFLPVLRYARTTADSMKLNQLEGGAIIIAGSGMCNGGRIRHHLKHNLWRRAAHVVFVGFQAAGTPGRALVDGATTFTMDGDEIAVKAAVHTLGGFSAHAGQSQLLDWTNGFTEGRPNIHLIHGEPTAKEVLQARLAADWQVAVPQPGSEVTL